MRDTLSMCSGARRAWLLAVFLMLSVCAFAGGTFTNPIIPPPSADPFVVQYNGYYYHIHQSTYQRTPGIAIRKTDDLTQLGKAKSQRVWSAPESGPYSREIWAPELHFYRGKWYIYVAADAGRNEDHQMWVIESEGSDPMGPYHQTPYHLETGGWAIDGTVLSDSKDHLYFVWSGWPGKVDGVQNLYIAPMESPTKISKERTLLSVPEVAWEKRSDHLVGLLEGPQVLKHQGKTFIIYSASGSWTEHYCLGLLEYLGGDMAKAENWKKHKEAPIFAGLDKVLGVGHCSFVTSPDESENWIVYHTKTKKENGWGDRNVQTQPFTFSEEGLPLFGKAVQPGVELPKPSGTVKKPVALRDNYSDTWVATDNLGRSLPGVDEVGKPKKDRSIGMFYFLWMGAHGTNGPFDVSKILAEYPEAVNDAKHPAWGPVGTNHHWGESWFGYYLSTDEAVFDKHARMLSDMGVDALIFDASNGFTYRSEYQALCRAFTRIREAGGRTPQIAFLCPFGNPMTSLKAVWKEFYSQGLYPELWYRWKGKPLIMADPSYCDGGQTWEFHTGAVELFPGETLGQSFHAEKPFLRVAASIPTWSQNDSEVTLKLYQQSPKGKLIEKKVFSEFVDNSWLTLRPSEALPAGDYYLEISEPVNRVGWWSDGEKEVAGGKAWKNGQEVAGGRGLRLVYEDDPDAAIADFFTFRKPQAEYFPGPTGPEQWGWLEVYPQHVFYDADHQPEQMVVGVAQNAVDGKLSVLSNPRSHGRSFHDGAEPGPEGQDTTGLNFQEQWSRVLEVNPPFVFITGWNEWIMMRFSKEISPFYGSGEVTFVDQFNAEYSRDIEPALCDHSDNYYYQCIANIRRYKGVRPLEKVRSAKVVIDGDFADWAKVKPEFRDDIGDPVHRNHLGYGKAGHYKNMTGRNDLITAKMSLKNKTLSAYVRTLEPMGSPAQKHWMLLFLDVDENPTNGWLGYDFVVRSSKENPQTEAEVCRFTGSSEEYLWEKVGTVVRCIDGTQMELAIPLEMLGLDARSLNYIDFKWADNIQETGQTRDLSVNGDVAPNDRYNYRALF